VKEKAELYPDNEIVLLPTAKIPAEGYLKCLSSSQLQGQSMTREVDFKDPKKILKPGTCIKYRNST